MAVTTLRQAINFIENQILECEPEDGCGRCEDTKQVVAYLERLTYNRGLGRLLGHGWEWVGYSRVRDARSLWSWIFFSTDMPMGGAGRMGTVFRESYVRIFGNEFQKFYKTQEEYV